MTFFIHIYPNLYEAYYIFSMKFTCLQNQIQVLKIYISNLKKTIFFKMLNFYFFCNYFHVRPLPSYKAWKKGKQHNTNNVYSTWLKLETFIILIKSHIGGCTVLPLMPRNYFIVLYNEWFYFKKLNGSTLRP